jgi:hypothetical protein
MKKVPLIVSFISVLVLTLGIALPVSAQPPPIPNVEPPVVQAEIPKNGCLKVEKKVNVEQVPVGSAVIAAPEGSEILNIKIFPPEQVKEDPDQEWMVFEEYIMVRVKAEPCDIEELLVTFYYVDEGGEEIIIGEQTVWIHVIDPIPIDPIIWCIEGVNPSGKTIPPAGSTTPPGSKGGRNDDGFYLIQWPEEALEMGLKPVEMWAGMKPGDSMMYQIPGHVLDDIIDPAVDVVVKLTEAPGAKPPYGHLMGSNNNDNNNGKAGAVRGHITLPGDRVFTAFVPNPVPGIPGMLVVRCMCLVPPPPK